ncbi:MAG: hypothetical protein KGL35_19235 [Bradyrhizobium sp.]|nr:hypothetical protein [Bradyrhizobium sp.]
MRSKSSKQRKAVRPQVPTDVVPEPPKANGLPSPKAVFDNPASAQSAVRPAAKVGFTISSSRAGETHEIQMTSPTLTVAKARMLFKSGWRVQITNAAGRQFVPSEFDEVLKFD